MDHQINDDLNWIETIVKVAGALGFNRVQVRWRLLAWVQLRRKDRSELVASVKQTFYEHKHCPGCGRLIDGDAKRCPHCQQRVLPWWLEVVSRVGGISFQNIPMSMVLILLLLLVYAKGMVMQGQPNHRIWAFVLRPEVMDLLGAQLESRIGQGEWFRLFTAMFLHFSVLHLFFNMVALAQIGPPLEQVIGRHKVVLTFLFSGLVGNVVYQLLDGSGMSAGASGGVMGLIGVGVGYGHRLGTGAGRHLRNRSIGWLLVTTVFGLYAGMNHLAHLGGFLAGVLLGYVRLPPGRASRALERLFTGLTLLSTGMILLMLGWMLRR